LDYLRYQGEYSSRKKENPVVILLDIKMPKLDGYKPSVSLKLTPVLKHIPIVMLTSSAMESDIVESYDLGVNAYVVKPIDFSEFVKKIKNIGIF
jgi:CheY-like chemotaxis protein